MTAPSGAVYDRGYRPYDGPRGGRGASRAALWRLSVRRALGLRRSWRQKVMPWSLLVVATLPAVLNIGIGYLTRDSPIEDFEFFDHREYVGVSTALLVFVAITAPDVVCPDRRNRALPLLFARPIDRVDYVVAKVGAIAAIVFGFGFLPHVVLFVGQMFVTSDGALDHFTENVEALWQVPVAVALLAVYYATVGVALASTTSRRVVGAVALLALVLITSSVSAVLVNAAGGESLWALTNVLALPLRVRDLVFLGEAARGSPLPDAAGASVLVVVEYVVIVATCWAFLVHRYREVATS